MLIRVVVRKRTRSRDFEFGLVVFMDGGVGELSSDLGCWKEVRAGASVSFKFCFVVEA